MQNVFRHFQKLQQDSSSSASLLAAACLAGATAGMLSLSGCSEQKNFGLSEQTSVVTIASDMKLVSETCKLKVISGADAWIMKTTKQTYQTTAGTTVEKTQSQLLEEFTKSRRWDAHSHLKVWENRTGCSSESFSPT